MKLPQAHLSIPNCPILPTGKCPIILLDVEKNMSGDPKGDLYFHRSKDFSKNGRVTIQAKGDEKRLLAGDGLSTGDISAINKLYKCKINHPGKCRSIYRVGHKKENRMEI